MASFRRGPTKNLSLIASLHQAFHWLPVGLAVPIIAHFQIERGLSLTQVALNGTATSLIILLLEIPTGGLADLIGRRRVYLISQLAKVVAALMFVFAMSAGLLLFGFLLFGVARALSSGTMDAYFVDAFQNSESAIPLQRFLGRIQAAIPVSLAVGGLFGGFLSGRLAAFSIFRYSLDPYSALFLLIAAVIIGQMLFTLLAIPRDNPSEKGDGSAPSRSMGVRQLLSITVQALRNQKVLRLLLLGAAAWGLAFVGLEHFWQPFVSPLVQHGDVTGIFGVLTFGYFIVAALGALAANWVFRRIGERYALAVGLLRLFTGGLLVLLAFTASVQGFAAVYWFLFLTNGMAGSPEQTLFNSAVNSENRSTMLSVESFFLQLGGASTLLLWGSLADRYSIALVWVIAGGLFALSSVFYFAILRHGTGASPE